MQSFITALVAYLACDGAASAHPLSQEEALDCARSYETVKVSFLSDEERRALDEGPAARAAALRTAYRRFSAWMADNPERVGRLRGLARGMGQDTAG